MNKPTTTTMLAFASLLASFSAAGCTDTPTNEMDGYLAKYASDPFGPAPLFRPSTCQEIADYVPGLTDGEYTLYVQNEATPRWKAYCANMQSTPTEYLSLVHDAGMNTSSYVSANGRITTAYEKVRIDPASLTIDIGDTTFATSTGTATHNGTTLTSMPYGIAMGCGAEATMNINLRGTQFRLESALAQYGTDVKPTATLSNDRKLLDMTATGTCGWVAQDIYVNPTSEAEQFRLRLSLFPVAM
jgi:plastocyanin